jgi:hypothetical protein
VTIRIIDNKKIELTDDEFSLYNEICKSYDNAHRRGKDLFEALFETDDNGVIIFLRPPTKKYSSMEVYMFLVGVMVHQHLGAACDQVDVLAQHMLEKEIEKDKRMAQKEEALDDLILRGNELLKRLESVEK